MSVRPLWLEPERIRQRARFRELELQCPIKEARRAWQMVQERRRALPAGVEVDSPSPRVLAAILGLFKTGATLKRGQIVTLELGRVDIAELLGLAESTVSAALRWLGCDDFETREGSGIWVRALGLVQRVKRGALARVDGHLRKVFRTSKSFLTALGEEFLGLSLTQRIARWAQRHGRRVRVQQQVTADVKRRQEAERPPPPPEVPPDADERARGLAWLHQIKGVLA